MHILEMVSAGVQQQKLPQNLQVYKLEYLIGLDEITLRRIGKGIEKEHQAGKHIALMATELDQFDQLLDPFLRNWMRMHCITVTNSNLLGGGAE
ncbi:hypothetical protein [Paenibacillus shenyangensis]|uniref:hypothetical protein n=1 Tax=Paenibacillus sp. A9 TaxID=1284352 RepID=UPI00036FA2C6|nr:hypothetical protein [Paenibacillus sp. A9]